MLNGFKDFILRGNVISMAIGLAVGAAFTAVVTAFTKAFITPLIGRATGSVGDFSQATFEVSGTEFPYGVFINAALAFVITAAVLYFLVVVPMAKFEGRFKKVGPFDIKAQTRDCPRCFSAVPAVATRCAHCTSEIKPLPEALEKAGLPAQR
ncbi:MscL family protein [Streptomyces sp. TRM49041]|uniref:large conductance mechanosensitive channel protein MscL n=1 Tax=Streptomyces sp. TRM49041 TaxID=2603216 RepID=UPI0011EBE49F|nr:MscL family protein [Streptomyces sp. TRM49041]